MFRLFRMDKNAAKKKIPNWTTAPYSLQLNTDRLMCWPDEHVDVCGSRQITKTEQNCQTRLQCKYIFCPPECTDRLIFSMNDNSQFQNQSN